MEIPTAVKDYVKILLDSVQGKLRKTKINCPLEYAYVNYILSCRPFDIDRIDDASKMRELIKVLQIYLGYLPPPPKEVKNFVNRR